MEVRNCRQCGRLYNYIGGSYRNLCPDCIRKIEDKFEEVKTYIDEHKNATMKQISDECDVGTKQLEQWIREERLTFSDDSPIGIACESCGTMIKSGKFCDNCKGIMANKLNNMYRKPVSELKQEKPDRTVARMRFLDKD